MFRFSPQSKPQDNSSHNDKLIDDFEEVAKKITGFECNVCFDDEEFLRFVNFISAINLNVDLVKGFTREQRANTLRILKGIPKYFIIVDEQGEPVNNHQRIAADVLNARFNISNLMLGN